MYVRISRGTFDPSIADWVEEKLRESEEVLAPLIARMQGNVHFYAGFDRASRTMVNVSVWTSERYALQMGHLREMHQLAEQFRWKGVHFETVVNYDVLWEHNG